MRRTASVLLTTALLIGIAACGDSDSPKENCTNGTDDDADGFIDCNDGSCASDPACQLGHCGDGKRGTGEDCDGADLGGQTCNALGLGAGALGCKADCSFDTTNCALQACGDGHIDPGEACDGADLNGKTCESEGRAGGVIGCMPDCTIDISGCGMPEKCNDGSDNDLDLLFDCSDPDCFYDSICSTGGETVCDDLIDDDGDGLIDCQDPGDCQNLAICVPSLGPTGAPCLAPRDCQAIGNDPVCLHEHDFDFPGGYCTEFCYVGADDCQANAVCVGQIAPSKSGLCMAKCTMDAECRAGYECVVVTSDQNGPIKGCMPSGEVCSGGIDDDDDGLIDCMDPGCDQSPACAEDCKNGGDDDGDGKIDCMDKGCRNAIECKEACNNDKDDDGDGFVDCKDAQCRYTVNCSEDCGNKIDDNGNGLVDCKDSVCNGDWRCTEYDCFDGIDNDDDGLVDCPDPDCQWICPPPPEECTGGIDEDLDGFIDCEDNDCLLSEPKCDMGPVCMSAPVLQNGVTVSASTVGGTNMSKGFCAFEGGALERIYRFDAGTVNDIGLLEINFDDMGNNLALYFRYGCGEPFSEMFCSVGPTSVGGGIQGGTYWFFVDGADAASKGAFTLNVKFTLPVCGNGVIESPEECDPPDGVTCDANCKIILGPENICDDLTDNDGDDLHDCIDPDCQGTPICVPGNAPVGNMCTKHADCAATGGDPICLYGWTDGFCTEGCDLMLNDCPMGSFCIPASPSEGLCMVACQSDMDCRPGYACGDVGFGPMCLPL